jgi:hypothetical protein
MSDTTLRAAGSIAPICGGRSVSAYSIDEQLESSVRDSELRCSVSVLELDGIVMSNAEAFAILWYNFAFPGVRPNGIREMYWPSSSSSNGVAPFDSGLRRSS